MLEFETAGGNMYVLDEKTGIFLHTTKTMKAVIGEIASKKSKMHIINKLKDKFDENEVSFCYDWLKKWEKIQNDAHSVESGPQIFNSQDVKTFLQKTGFLQLILSITEDCNFRCRYCVYSDNYAYTRNHSDNYMDFSTAKKAIDYYFGLLKEGDRYNPLRKPTISFYGGEPLLNFKIIQQCFEYVKNEYKNLEILYTVTTNGSLLEKDKAEWLMQNNFFISISLDGNEKDQNRLRMYSDKDGTFEDVMKNIQYIVEKGYENINSLPVYDWKSDLFDMDSFFYRKDVPSIMRLAPVDSTTKTKYYKKFNEEDFNKFKKLLEKARDSYYAESANLEPKERESVFDHLIGRIPSTDIFNSRAVTPPHPIMPYTGSCVPGRKLFVDVDGKYHMCERVNDSLPIGNVDEGLNFEKISHLLSDYLSHMDRCPECKVKWKCICCFKQFMTDEDFIRSSEICEAIESSMKDSLVDSFEIAEKYPNFVERTNFKYKNVKKYYEAI